MTRRLEPDAGPCGVERDVPIDGNCTAAAGVGPFSPISRTQ